ncbi:WXG100 family type VII secretion target [Nocardia sp. ET3-3]|uniref:WXG100 family type VII secretion target n=1 Tax=Nocardia terrae TaxID=2675851 RepID=A0A7K1V4J9_9NOCA|nr:WXG100 family type VII secretion target [Nocardia terrae]MVU81544.1 WXG100 family type VII secretion target [Nocardia terrae]
MSKLWSDPERLHAVAPRFEQLGEEVNTALETLKSGIDAEGRCWGGDAPGKSFEAKYPQGDTDGGVGQALSRLSQLMTLLKGTGDRVSTVATGLQTQDKANADPLIAKQGEV